MEIQVGGEFKLSEEQSLRIVEPVPTRSGLGARWLAEDVLSGASFEIFVLEEHHRAHEVVQDCLDGLWGYVHVKEWGEDLLVMDLSRVHTLDALCATRRTALRTPSRNRSEEGQFHTMLHATYALGELFEILHEIHDRCIIHAGLDVFALRTNAQGALEAIIRRPETLHPRAKLPNSGSFHSLGLDPPEVVGLTTRPLDLRADVYILAAIAFALFTGRPLGVQSEQCLDHIPDVRHFDPEIPPYINSILHKALSRWPEHRHASPHAFVEALRDACTQWAARLHPRADRGLSLAWTVLSDIGLSKRMRSPVNQDASLGLFDPETQWGLFAVLDGVSRSQIGSGEMASWSGSVALEREWNTRRQTPIYGRFFEGDTPFPANFARRLARCAHLHVVDQLRILLAGRDAIEQPVSTLCSTLSALVFFRDRVACVSVGDSPVYLLHTDLDGDEESVQLVQLNPEHTVRLRSFEQGHSLYEASNASNAKALYSALGKVTWTGQPLQAMSAELETFVDSFRIFPGDLLLIASDGVPNALGQDAEELITKALTPALRAWRRDRDIRELMMRKSLEFLINESNKRGGRDNLTLLAISLGEPCIQDS